MIWRAERNVRKRTKTSQIEWCCEASFNRNSNFTVLEFLINKRMVLTRNPPWTEGFILVMCEKRLYQPNWRTKFSHRYYFIFSLKGLDLSGKSLELFTTSQALFWKDIIRKSKFPQNPKRSVRFSGKRTKRSVQKRKARNTQKAETKVL